MIRIRLRRVGSKGQPSYRIVVADGRSPRDGRFIEKIGFYNPRTEPATMEIDEGRALHWLSVGAQPSDAVQRILDRVGTTERYQRLRAGEAVEALVAEAEQALQAQPAANRRTRRDDIVAQKVSRKARARAEAATAAAVAEAPAAAAEAEADAVSEAAAE